MISAGKIYFNYENKELFAGFDFFAEKGEKVALTGKSGYGKTTFLMMLGGLIAPDNGEIIIDGLEMSVSKLLEARQKIVMLPQNVSAIGSGNVMETILAPFDFALNRHLKPDKEIISRELQMLDLPDESLMKKYTELSGGEKQRVGLIICKLLRKPIILLDEPSSALDKGLVAKAASYILSNPETTVISVTHDQNWMNACTRIVEFGNARG